MILSNDPFKIIRSGCYHLQKLLNEFNIVLNQNKTSEYLDDIENLKSWLNEVEKFIYET